MKFQMFPEKYGWGPLLWMIYLVFPLLFLIGMDGIKGLLGLALFSLFIFVYRDSYWNEHHVPYNILLMTTIVVIFVFVYHEGFLYMGLYNINAFMLVQRRWIYWSGYGLQILLVASILSFHFMGLYVVDISYIGAAILMIIVIPIISAYQIRWEQTKEELQEAHHRIDELVKHQERERIARDLHDTVGQTLSMITLKSEIAQRLIQKDTGRAEEEINEIHDISRTVLQQIREIVTDLKHLSYNEEVKQAKEVLDQVGIEAIYKGEEKVKNLNQLYENILAYCLKECTTNILRHSGATTCLIEKRESEKDIQLLIEDDGVGLQDGFQKSNGLAGMEERLHMISGSLTIDDAEMGGCHIRITVPKVQGDSQEQEGEMVV
ncbi:histidine kinase [Pontibacillus yanchengensis]|uniref:histidine kinase n=1 Tax=Pontibacillus yanchengensis Y32 TaxID=1385514 RepID=A0A0A2T986_9BACI|nr:sensor histidine kinase [Pontibacillus yanchengensis]KGP72129.1 histidine kinase [Pontibacillus yanchengensis Y32]